MPEALPVPDGRRGANVEQGPMVDTWHNLVHQLREEMLANEDDWDWQTVTTSEDWIARIEEMVEECGLTLDPRL